MRSPIRTILVLLDFSRCSLDALSHASSLSTVLGASIDLLHVQPASGAFLGEAVLVHVPAQHASVLETFLDVPEDEAFLALRKLEAQDFRRERLDVSASSVADAILQIAHQRRPDLIVMGTHGRTGLARVVRGSVAEAVMRRAPCPVTTVRPSLHSQESNRDVGAALRTSTLEQDRRTQGDPR